MNQKRFDKITLFVWLILGVLNLILAVNVGHWISWMVSGYMFGGAIVMLTNNPHMNYQRKTIKRLFKEWDNTIKDYQRAGDEILKLRKELKNERTKSRKRN